MPPSFRVASDQDQRAPRRGVLKILSLLALGLWSQVAGWAQPEATSWKAGAASVEISPELPMWMSGYGSRKVPGEKVAAKLYAKALAIEDAAGTTLVFVTADLLGFPGRLRQEVGAAVAARYGLARESLILNASHTHCGPELRAVDTSLGELDPARTKRVAAYQAQLTQRIITLVGDALERRVPATLAYGQAQAGFAMNCRPDYRFKSPDPRAGKTPNPTGPVDHDVPVLEVKVGGQIQAIVFGYACHNTTSGDFAFHGDYAGFAQASLEKRYPGAMALFLAGCGADQNPSARRDIPGRTAITLAGLHSQTLALAVEAALGAPMQRLAGPLRIGAEVLPPPYLTPPNRAELEKRLGSRQENERDYARVLLDIFDWMVSSTISNNPPRLIQPRIRVSR